MTSEGTHEVGKSISNQGVISGISVSHRYATVDEIASAGAGSVTEDLERLRTTPGVSEAFVIYTCNRREAYVVTPSTDRGRMALDGFAPSVRDGAVVRRSHEASLKHLMRLAAGLESAVVGEDQILGQLSDAFETARKNGTIGPVLDVALSKAVMVGKRARTETAINDGTASVGSAAVRRLAEQRGFDDATILIIGAGTMARAALRELEYRPIDSVILANRTPANAEAVLSETAVNGDVIDLAALPEAVARADVLIAATDSETPIVHESMLEGDSPSFLAADLGQPRDIDPSLAQNDAVTLLTLDDIEAVIDETDRERQAAVDEVESMIETEHDRVLTELKRTRADTAIAAMHESAQQLQERELSRALTELQRHGDLTDDQRAIVESLAESLVNKLLAAPTSSLRSAAESDDWSTIVTAMELFDPEFEDGLPEDLPEQAMEGIEQAE